MKPLFLTIALLFSSFAVIAETQSISGVDQAAATPWIGAVTGHHETYLDNLPDEPRASAVVTFEPEGMINSKIYLVVGSPDAFTKRTFVIEANGGTANSIEISKGENDTIVFEVEMPGYLSEDGGSYNMDSGKTVHKVVVSYENNDYEYKNEADYSVMIVK